MDKWLNKVLTLRDVAQLYLEKAGQWLLLEVLETDARNEPTRLKLLAYAPNKDQLHDYMLEDEDWNWDRKYLMVLADPNKPCTID